MKKILIVNDYRLHEYLIYIQKHFETYGYNIIFYSLFNENTYENKNNNEFFSFFKQHNPEIIIWSSTNFNIELLNNSFITNKDILEKSRVYNILFSWNDPFIWKDHNFTEKLKYFNLILCSCKTSIEKYSGKTIFFPQGFEDSIENKNEEYKCDISICCFELYSDIFEYPNQFINRKKIIDDLVYISNTTDSFSFHIYGPEPFRYMYPKNYQGLAEYNQLKEIYKTSKINLNTHVYNDEFYVNERAIMVCASNALLLTDPCYIPEYSCIYLKKDYISQVKEILSNYNSYSLTKKRAKDSVKQFSFQNLVKIIHEEISLYFLDDSFYRKVFEIPNEITDLEEYFKNNNSHIPYLFTVPEQFDFETFILDNVFLLKKQKEYIYWYYIINKSKNQYILVSKDKNFNLQTTLNSLRISQKEWFEINSVLENIRNKDMIQLLELSNIINKNSMIDIAGTLQLYFSF